MTSKNPHSLEEFSAHAVATVLPFICPGFQQSGFCFHYFDYYNLTGDLVNLSKVYIFRALF